MLWLLTLIILLSLLSYHQLSLHKAALAVAYYWELICY